MYLVIYSRPLLLVLLVFMSFVGLFLFLLMILFDAIMMIIIINGVKIAIYMPFVVRTRQTYINI